MSSQAEFDARHRKRQRRRVAMTIAAIFVAFVLQRLLESAGLSEGWAFLTALVIAMAIAGLGNWIVVMTTAPPLDDEPDWGGGER